MDPRDPLRTANLLINHYGKGAKAHAVQRVQDMRKAGDVQGEWAWMGVFDAVLVLEATTPADGKMTH